MPWKETGPMDQKVQFIADWNTGYFTKVDLMNKYGISRKTVYKWIDRYQRYSIEGLREMSRRPAHNPNQTSDEIIKLLIDEKLKNRSRGPKKIRVQLEKKYTDISFPSPSTIGHWLRKNGLVEKRKKRLRVPPYIDHFVECKSPNDVWSADYKGQFDTKDSRACYPLTISDNYSRYLLKCNGLYGPRYEPTRKVFVAAFKEFGLPEAIRSDNGAPFAGRCVGGLSRLSIWWIQLGIIPERIEKGCPQQNGRHERMHRTLKAEVLSTIASNIEEQQARFDFFRMDYNNLRPHEALIQRTPNSYYQKSNRPYVERSVVPDYDYGFTVRHVKRGGEISFKGHLYYLTELLTGQPIGLKEKADGLWEIYYSFYRLGTIDLWKNRVIR